ncbi:MAG: WD40 repeat domain-containing protein [Verrucomicrobia bacterium]|nr:WD40 repeat domain-containing protein [Verrucomicrobiota bacterium]
MNVKIMHQWNTEDIGSAVAISPNGKLVLSCGLRESIDLFDVQSGKVIRNMEGHQRKITCFAISPDSRFALSGADNGEIRLWELDNGRCHASLKGHSERVSSVEFCPDGKLALSGSWDKSARLWSLDSRQSIRVFEGHSGNVTDACVSPDSRLAVTSGFDASVRIWDMNTGKCLSELPGHQAKTMSVAISGNGKCLVSGDAAGQLAVSDLPFTKLKTMGPFSPGISKVHLSEDGMAVLIGLQNGALWSLNLATQDATMLFQMTGRLPEHLPMDFGFSVSKDGHYMICTRALSAAIVNLGGETKKSFFGKLFSFGSK